MPETQAATWQSLKYNKNNSLNVYDSFVLHGILLSYKLSDSEYYEDINQMKLLKKYNLDYLQYIIIFIIIHIISILNIFVLNIYIMYTKLTIIIYYHYPIIRDELIHIQVIKIVNY
jgi:hypothetical protein